MNGLLWVYLLGGILEIVGILYTGKIGRNVVSRGFATSLWLPSRGRLSRARAGVVRGGRERRRKRGVPVLNDPRLPFELNLNRPVDHETR